MIKPYQHGFMVWHRKVTKFISPIATTTAKYQHPPPQRSSHKGGYDRRGLRALGTFEKEYRFWGVSELWQCLFRDKWGKSLARCHQNKSQHHKVLHQEWLIDLHTAYTH